MRHAGALVGCVLVGCVRMATAGTCVQGWNGSDLTTTQSLQQSVAPRFKLAMCTGYNSDACCLPIHQTEIQDSYTHLVDVAHRCIETLSQEYPALRQYFCMYCNPNMLSYFSCCHNWEWEKPANHDNRVFKCNDRTYYNGGSCDAKAVNTIRLCSSFASKLFPSASPGDGLDMCGMSMWVNDKLTETDHTSASYNPNGIIPWGAVDGTSGDDPVVPSKFWAEGVRGFVRDVRPPLLEDFFVEVVPDSEGHCFTGAAYRTIASLWALLAVACMAAAGINAA